MNFLKNILSALLLLAVLNTTVTKAIHEFLEHKHEEHTCLNKDQIHFHENEFAHLDLICDFNFTTHFFSEGNDFVSLKLAYYTKLLKTKYIHLLDNLFHFNFLLRGPPTY